MKRYNVINIPQKTDWDRSFNVLVPLEIQGKECEVLKFGSPPEKYRGSTSTIIRIDGKIFGVPAWAVKKKQIMDFSI